MNDKPTLRHYIYASLLILGLLVLEPTVEYLANHFEIVLAAIAVVSGLVVLDYLLNDTQRNTPEARRKEKRHQ